MARFKPATKKTVIKALEQFIKDVKDDGNEEYIVDAVNRMFDELLGDDFFGTEGQNDPRGDHRD